MDKSSVHIVFFSTGKQLFSQEEKEIDEKRETILNVNDTLIKLSAHVYAIVSKGEAENIAVYENPDGLVLVDHQWIELIP